MASVIKMPRMSDTMEEGQLVRWLKAEGDEVSPGMGIAEVETDKATLELESFEDGVIIKLLAEAGSAVAIGAPVAIIGDDADEDISELLAELGGAPAKAAQKPAEPSVEAKPTVKAADPAPTPAAAAPAAAAPAAAAPAAAAPVARAQGRLKASPLARKMAEEMAVDIAVVPGSGPGGRIIARDIEQAAQAPRPVEEVVAVAPVAQPQTQDGDVQALSPMRKTIARRMVAAKQAVPHFYLTMDIDMGPAAEFRAQLNAAAAGAVKISFNDMIVKACALALSQHRWVNASYAGDNVVFHNEAHVGIAVALEGGLITPVVRSAQAKSLGQIARDSRDLATRAVDKKLRPEEYQGGTFTVSNLGMFGIREFVAIIDTPQAAILAVGAVSDVPVVVGGQLAVGKRMAVTLSCDHRVVDGAAGAEFLGTVKKILENPLQLVL